VATGTGFVGQYHPAVSKVYESTASCPDALLLFMHHVPYTHRLHSGKTVIQYIYDSHYAGAAAVDGYLKDWNALKGRVDDERFVAVNEQLTYQAGQAVVWRDAVSRWFHRASGIADTAGRVDHYPARLEAEAASLTGYKAAKVTPWEAASGDGAVECASGTCSAAFNYAGVAGRHDLVVQYFDVNTGAARFRVKVGDRVIGEWTASDRLPTRRLDGSSSTRQIFRGVSLQRGDTIVVEGTADAGETAALDYIETLPAGRMVR
jgi:alpha-glucuronidase